MRFVTFQRNGSAPEPGVFQDGRITGLAGAGFATMLDVIAGGDEALKKVAGALRGASTVDASSVKILAPIPRPNKVICVGLNYRDHAKESNMEIPKVPTIFNKFASSVIGPGDKVILPAKSEKPDYEAEFAFVIGKGGRYIKAQDWRQHIFGYTIINDVSARDFQMATTQWLMGKTFDTFCPMGPYITTADEVPDPHDLDIKMTINGEVLQNSNTRELIFRIPELIEYLSSVFTLEPGDIVSTGTPAGVGLGHKPPRWLKPGDSMTVSVDKLGELTNPVVAE